MAELLSDFLAKEHTPQAMLIGRGILPKSGKLIIGGRPKIGKSYLVLNMALDLALGKPLFDAYYDSPGKAKPVFPVYRACTVLYIENEIGEIGLQDRLRTITGGGDMGSIPLYIKSRDMGMRMDQPAGREKITAEIAQVKPDVVFLDPLAKFHLSDENSAQEMSAVLRVGDHWIEDYGCSLVYIHHIGHQDPQKPRFGGDRLRGSSAIFGDADAILNLERKSSASAKEPVLSMSFELRRDEPLEDIDIRKRRDGRIVYIGQGLSEAAVEEHASQSTRGAKPRKGDRYNDL